MSQTPCLRPYQREGVRQLIDLVARHGSALLADEPGLGKTVQVAEYCNQTHPANVLVVCPASLRINWQKELDRWLNRDAVAFTCIRSYEQVVADNYPDVTFDLIVFDEAHYLKNPTAKRTKACLSVEARARLFLTGTPVVNRPMDMFPILQSMGAKWSRTEFGKRYCAGKLITVRWKPKKKLAWDFSGASHQEELNAILRKHCMVRRTKAEVLTELPEKIRQVIELDIPDVESSTLKAAVTRLFNGMEHAAANLGELKKIAFTELAAARLDIARAKLPAVLERVNDVLEEEDKVVVFAYHREIIDDICGEYGDSAVRLYGGMTDKQKNAAVEAFQNGDARVFVGQITAAGTGLTLTRARTVVFAELEWVPGNVTQAEDRCHRLGQRDTVRVIHLAARNSVDARMIKALVYKQSNIDRITR